VVAGGWEWRQWEVPVLHEEKVLEIGRTHCEYA
jgi:hypothetical protein